MKRYYNNRLSSLPTIGERIIRTSHDGLVHELFRGSGIKYTYEVDEATSSSSHLDITVLHSDLSKINVINTRSTKAVLLARVVGLYKRSYKKKNWSKRRTLIKGRLLAVGTKLGILKRKHIFSRKIIKLLSRRKLKLIMWRSIGKLYRVCPLFNTKYGVVYKRVGV